jgi:hypothetical protein
MYETAGLDYNKFNQIPSGGLIKGKPPETDEHNNKRYNTYCSIQYVL